jgi:DNA-binding LacI/PurR family transcriptional regulator
MGTLRLPVVPEYLVTGDHAWSEASGGRAARTLMALEQPPTAIVAASDALALGALRELRRQGVNVPEEVALVCFDDPHDGDLMEPSITALGRHYRELGEVAAELLLEALRGGVGDVSRDRAEIRIPLELVIRTSCGCTPPGPGGSADVPA